MSVLPALIVLLLGPGPALGYLYLAKASPKGCPYACAGTDFIVQGGGLSTGDYPLATPSEARANSRYLYYPCLPLPPQFYTWGRPYQQDEGYWSVGSSQGDTCNYLTGPLVSVTSEYSFDA